MIDVHLGEAALSISLRSTLGVPPDRASGGNQLADVLDNGGVLRRERGGQTRVATPSECTHRCVGMTVVFKRNVRRNSRATCTPVPVSRQMHVMPEETLHGDRAACPVAAVIGTNSFASIA